MVSRTAASITTITSIMIVPNQYVGTHSDLKPGQMQSLHERPESSRAVRVAEVQQAWPTAQHAQQRQPAAGEPHLALVSAPILCVSLQQLFKYMNHIKTHIKTHIKIILHGSSWTCACGTCFMVQ